MEPFGPDNPQPVFIAKGVTDSGFSKIVKDHHLRFVVKQKNCELKGIGFNLAHKYPIVASGKPFDIVFHLDENEWQGMTSIQMRVIDIKGTEALGQ
jgi:single-stranded-DNA-specific exonuclease